MRFPLKKSMEWGKKKEGVCKLNLGNVYMGSDNILL